MSDSLLCAQIQKGWDTFDKYYSLSDNSPFYAAAIVLHPNRRTRYIRHNWRKEWQRPALQAVKKLWESYRDTISVDSLAVVDSLGISLQETRLSRNQDTYDIIKQDLYRYNRSAGQDEYEDYIAENTIPIHCTALSWWLMSGQKERWPRLSKMAIDILSIPAMSAEPERVFSGARRTISWERMQLGEETIERVECLKSWMRTDLCVNTSELQNIEG